MDECRYVLISAVRNEAEYIDGLIDTILAQTIQPIRWIIVDDGSTDDTHARATARSQGCSFIRVIQPRLSQKRDFASKVFALQAGFGFLSTEEFDFVGFVDADIRLGAQYYEEILNRFSADEHLGIAGGVVIQRGEPRPTNHRLRSLSHHVAGGVQLFRKECYEQVGGYLPIATGGEDTVAEVTASMRGWKTKTYGDISASHLRPDGLCGTGSVLGCVRWGERFYAIGYHPFYFLAHSIARILDRPPFLGTILQNIGFYKGFLLRQPVAVSKEFQYYLRKTQLARLRGILKLRY